MLLANAPMPVHSICTSPEVPRPSSDIAETHVPHRPHLGKLDYSRFANIGNSLDKPFRNTSRKRMLKVLKDLDAKVVQIVAHGYGFSTAFEAAKELRLPVILTVHDDLRYTLKDVPNLSESLGRLAEAWQRADARIVICDEMGEEYCRRYGARPFSVITDGLESIIPYSPSSDGDSPKSLYFMGLTHQGCLPNLKAVLEAMAGLGDWQFVLRSGVMDLPFSNGLVEKVTFLPYGSQADVQADMVAATALYQPLPIGDEYADMIRFSLSTKMVSYLGSGKPILYHGPAEAATGRLLARWGAAEPVDTLNPEDIAAAMNRCVVEAKVLTANARKLATDRFVLADKRKLFWEVVQDVMKSS